MKTIKCDPECGFMVKSHDEEEVVSMAREHSENKHGVNATDEELKGMMTDE